MKIVGVLFIACILISCEEQFGLDKNKISQNIISSSLSMFEGEIIEHSGTEIEGVDLWKVKIENNKGALVSFYWQKNYTKLFRIEGEKGPFDYDLKPPLSTIVLSTARFLAFESSSTAKLLSWKLLRQKPDQDWVYEFILEGTQSPISINALSGDRL